MKMKQFLCGFLAIVLMFGLLTACGNSTNNNGNEDKEQDDVDQEESEYRDMFEAEFKGVFHGREGYSENMFWPEPTTETAERARKVSSTIEERLNCTLTEEAINQPSMSHLQQRMATGDYTTSFWHGKGELSGYMKSGFIENWDDISCIDWSDEKMWGNETNRRVATFNGKIWADVNGGSYYCQGALLFNNELIKEFGVTSPQTLWEEGTWTWKTFETYLPTVSMNTADRSVKGLSVFGSGEQLVWAAIDSNGGEAISIDENGKGSFALNSAAAMEALTWVNELYRNPETNISLNEQELWAQGGSTFHIGDFAFGTGSSGSSAHWGLDNLDDFAFISFPQGPKVEYGSRTGAWVEGSGSPLMLCFGQDKEDTGYVWTVRKQVRQELIGEDDEEEWKRKTFFTEESFEHYDRMRNDCLVLFAGQYSDSKDKVTGALLSALRGDQSPAAAIGSIVGMVEAELATTMNAQ